MCPHIPATALRTGIRRLSTSLLLLFLTLLGGCAAFSGYPERPLDLASDFEQIKESASAKKMAECADKKGDDAASCRNRFIAARMYATDIRFSEFEAKLFRQTRESGFAATLGTLGLTSAAALTTGGASQVLSGIAALVIGGREAFQKEVLAERTVIAIHTAMRARRSQVRLRLLDGLRQTIDRYPLELALANVNEYYDAGTVLGALIGITETVGAEAKEADAKLLELTPLSKVSFEVEATTLRRAMLSAIPRLAPDQILAIVATPPTAVTSDMTRQATAIDPHDQRRTNADAARAVLQAWLSQAVHPSDYPKWAARMGVVP